MQETALPGITRDVGHSHAPQVRGSRLPVLRFFLISHGYTWLCWAGAAYWGGTDIWESPARWLVYLGGIGPLLAGVIMIGSTRGYAGLRELWWRIVDPRRVPLTWMLVAVLVPVIAMGIAVGAGALAGSLDRDVDASRLVELLANPAGLVAFAFFVLLFGPIPEEIGWRGYALDALQERWSALTASLALGTAWALWHAPLFFIGGYYADGGPPEPIHFTVAILAHSVLYTWLYNHTSRSVLVAIVFHFMINFVGMLVEGAAWVEWVRTGATVVLAVVVVGTCGARTLRRATGSTRPFTG